MKLLATSALLLVGIVACGHSDSPPPAFFVNLLDMSTKWQKSTTSDGLYDGLDRATGKPKWPATPVDPVFGSHSESRAVAEVYAAEDGKQKFAQEFVKVDEGDDARSLRRQRTSSGTSQGVAGSVPRWDIGAAVAPRDRGAFSCLGAPDGSSRAGVRNEGFVEL